jgi:hypothetical protein
MLGFVQRFVGAASKHRGDQGLRTYGHSDRGTDAPPEVFDGLRPVCGPQTSNAEHVPRSRQSAFEKLDRLFGRGLL